MIIEDVSKRNSEIYTRSDAEATIQPCSRRGVASETSRHPQPESRYEILGPDVEFESPVMERVPSAKGQDVPQSWLVVSAT